LASLTQRAFTFYPFSGRSSGADPATGLIQDTAGDIYGTAPIGGAQGVVFKLALDGTETLVHSLTGRLDP
jgi:hypothetical protein